MLKLEYECDWCNSKRKVSIGDIKPNVVNIHIPFFMPNGWLRRSGEECMEFFCCENCKYEFEKYLKESEIRRENLTR